MNDELLYNKIYEKTKECGRDQFIKLLMQKERENQELKNQQKEFIEYLKNWLEILEGQFEGMHGVNAAYQKLIIDTVNEVLSKYKEIIGEHE